MSQFYNIIGNKIVPAQSDDSTISIYINPTNEEKAALIESHGIDEHTLNSAIDPDELSRIEFEDNHVAIIVKKPQTYSSESGYQFNVASTGIFLFEEKIIIISDSEIPVLTDKRFMKVQSVKSFLMLTLGYCIYHFVDHLKIMRQISDELENKINASMENKYLLFMFSLSKGLVYYLNAISSNGILLHKMKNNQKIMFNENEQELLEDILIDNSQCYRLAEIYSNIVSSMMDARASVVSNNINILMKTLNVVTIAIMVPTFVVSAFSMNVKIPISEHSYAFWIILGLAAISVGIFLSFWRLKKW
ncbi:magnesium transporter CorA family protein [Desulforegula conservatrix]|uniref:magnesium transporter CorA family protein n=1 Tax=Desulforegula conservatrix TaxID=153026 RepID=UPI0004251DE5|nr:magnesium transporter CorA family protein [Desulforegula conservatrix]